MQHVFLEPLVEEPVGIELLRVGAPKVCAPVHEEDAVRDARAFGDVDRWLGGVGRGPGGGLDAVSDVERSWRLFVSIRTSA